jgi:hypothetical protein
LRTAARDVRVTRTKPRGPHLTTRCVEAHTFALNVTHRLRRCHRLFTAVDTTLRHVAPNTVIQPLYQQNRIELAPRLTLTVRPERQVQMLEQQIETRLLWRPGAERAEPPPVERIIRLVATCTERQRSLSSHERHSVPPAPEVHNIVTRVRPDNLNRPLDAVPNYRQPLAIEMVVYRPQSATPTTTAAPEAAVSERPHVTGHWPTPSPSPTTPPLDGSYLKRLTDSVVEALDRRTIAAYERAGRRSA